MWDVNVGRGGGGREVSSPQKETEINPNWTRHSLLPEDTIIRSSQHPAKLTHEAHLILLKFKTKCVKFHANDEFLKSD